MTKTADAVSATHLCSMPLCCSCVNTKSTYMAGTWMSTSMSTATCSLLSGLQKSTCGRRQSQTPNTRPCL